MTSEYLKINLISKKKKKKHFEESAVPNHYSKHYTIEYFISWSYSLLDVFFTLFPTLIRNLSVPLYPSPYSSKNMNSLIFFLIPQSFKMMLYILQ